MLFNSFSFLAFLGIVLILYYSAPNRFRQSLLLAASFVFYGWWDYRFLALLIATAALDYWVSHRIYEHRESSVKKRYLYVSLIGNLGVLFFFKYFGFFSSAATEFLNLFGIQPSFLTLNVILPVGISFYTFQALSYTIDVYRGKIPPVRRLSLFLLYISFFPQLVAGPIERSTHLVPQLESPKSITRSRVWIGLWFIVMGLLKKVAVGDTLATVVDPSFAHWEQLDTLHAWEAAILVQFQFYFDFSGYSDIAVGVAQWFGVDLVRNFRQPFFSASVTEFWRRWHVSLSTWFRDYVYRSLGGKGASRILRQRNIIITMALCGLWHGANYTFIVWGVLHGTFMAIEIWFNSRGRSLGGDGRIFRTFLLCTTANVFFRATTLTSASHMTQVMFIPQGDWNLSPLLMIALGIAAYCLFDYPVERTKNPLVWFKLPKGVQVSLLAAGTVIVGLLMLTNRGPKPFVYFQF